MRKGGKLRRGKRVLEKENQNPSGRMYAGPSRQHALSGKGEVQGGNSAAAQ